MGLLAPELVVYCAWIQWRNARELSKRLQLAKYSPKHPWTLSHSFFAGMGGFAVNCSDFIPGRDLLYSTTAGVRRIIELGYPLPYLHKEAIEDRSKADPLGKILVCLQAGYIIFQVVGRLAAHLPVTLLEVNTIGHVVCALAMYTFWFHKPLGVCDPIVLTNEWAYPLMILWDMKNGKSNDMSDARPLGYSELDIFMLFARPERRMQVESQLSGPLPPATSSMSELRDQVGSERMHLPLAGIMDTDEPGSSPSFQGPLGTPVLLERRLLTKSQ
jgi:hypothetical protein